MGSVSPSMLLRKLGLVLLGLLLGELLHRIKLLIEELAHVEERYRGNKRDLLQAVFSNCHGQAFSAPALIVLGGCLVTFTDPGPSMEALTSVLSLAVVYFCLRTCGALDNSLEDMQVLEEKNALLGPGLATNYWFSLVKWIIKGDVYQAQDFTRSTKSRFEDIYDVMDKVKKNTEDKEVSSEDEDEELDNIKPDGLMMSRIRAGTNFKIFPKIIILLPASCHLNIRKQQALRADNVFLHCAEEVTAEDPQCQCEDVCQKPCPHQHCCHDWRFQVEAVQRRPAIKQTVHWIYEHEEDERVESRNASKIFVMFDFPMLLQSAMGPGREMADTPVARAKNVETFQTTLVSFLKSNDYLKYRDLVTFHPYCQEEGPLSAQLRERVRLEKEWLR